MNRSYILAVDQGTSSTKTIIFDEEGKAVVKASEPLHTFYNGDFAEQDPESIYQNVLLSVKKCLEKFQESGQDVSTIKSCGISNQRETFVVWDENGVPLYNAVVWQCKRSSAVCGRLKQEGLEDIIRSKTGLLIDPYFSGTKLIWLNENVENVRRAISSGKAFFGTVDTWLLYRLSGGEHYFTDYTNASRTLFFNLSTLDWDTELLDIFGLTGLNLPDILPSSANFGAYDFNGIFPSSVPVNAIIGDSHAAAFGEGCFSPGTAKATLGTGCSILMNIGQEVKKSGSGMVSTICWSMENRTDYALEGVIVSCGATLEWLKNELGLFNDSRQTEAMACAVDDTNDVYVIPAFSGLGAPHWDMGRKASITGITFGSNKNHIVRAALESIAYQIKDVITAMEQDTGIELKELMVNGGITSNGFVLQFLSDLLQKPVINGGMPDVSALGAAGLAGLKAGIYKDLSVLEKSAERKQIVYPNENEAAFVRYAGWKKAISGGMN